MISRAGHGTAALPEAVYRGPTLPDDVLQRRANAEVPAEATRIRATTATLNPHHPNLAEIMRIARDRPPGYRPHVAN